MSPRNVDSLSLRKPLTRLRCDGLSRRNAIEIGCLTSFGLSSLRGSSAMAATSGAGSPRAKNSILIWLDGGPSHLETFDLKPDAPREVRGPLNAIDTDVGGIQISECLPGLARRMKHVALIRSMTSPLGEHNLGTHYLLTGHQPSPVLDYPAFQSAVAWHRTQTAGDVDAAAGAMPRQVAIPDASVGGAGFRSEGFLPSTCRPFAVGGDPAAADFQVRDLNSASLGIDRISQRREFVQQLAQSADSGLGESLVAARPELDAAFRMALSDDVRRAFDLNAESAQTRQRYGPRSIGQSCLLARRLVEHGVSLVTVNHRGWDTHADLYTQLKEGFTGAKDPVGLIPNLDRAVSALLDDLNDTGLLSDTLVLIMGEFGRTPKLNAAGGRDHWPRAFSVAVAGGGVRGGQVIGSTNRSGELPLDRPVTPAELAASIYLALGVPADQQLMTDDNRPVRLVSETVQPVTELW